MEGNDRPKESVQGADNFPPVVIDQLAEIPPVVIDQSENHSCSIDQSSEEHADPVAEQAPKKRKPRSQETRRRRTKGDGGLQLERTGIWTLRCKINGKRISKSTGTRDRQEAEQFARRYLAPYVKDSPEKTYENIQVAIMTERQLAAKREEEGPQMKLSEMWAAYESSPHRRDLSPSTLAGKKQTLEKFLEYMAKTFPEVVEVRNVHPYHTEHYLNYLRKDHSASTYNNRLCILREVYRTVMKKAAAKANPWEGYPMRADDSHTRRELTIEELARLVDVAARKGHEWRTLFGIAMYTGLRLGDCCKLTWAEVDIVRSIIQKIPEKTKKYRKGRPVTVPIHRVLSDLLMQTPVDKRTGYVLPTIGKWASGGKGGMWRIHYRIGKIFSDAGIVSSVKVEGRKWKAPEASFHSLRHTFVSMSANAGVPLHIVQAIVGHESTAMTRHYYHENVAALQRAVEAIPSISETGDVSDGEVARPDPLRMMPRYDEFNKRIAPPRPAYALPMGNPVKAPVPPAGAAAAPGAAVVPPPPNYAPKLPAAPEEAVYVEEPARVRGADGVVRPNPHAEAPLTGPYAERNEVRRVDKLAAVEAANDAAREMGGWGADGSPAPQTPVLNRRHRNEWIGRCIKRWSERKKIALLAGTNRLVGNGGYFFLQEMYEAGRALSMEDILDALDSYLAAKG